MLAVSEGAQVPLGLAVIPERAEAVLFEQLNARVDVLQHGYDHRNRALKGEKPTEFPPTEAVDSALGRLAAGRSRLLALAGARVLPVLVPPWNRFSAALIAGLPNLGIRGLSTFAPRERSDPAPDVYQANTHVDVIAWKRGRVFVGEERALTEAVSHLIKRRTGAADQTEPTGWLTHHACHDESIWTFLQRLFEQTCGRPDVRWLRPAEIFRGAGNA
jgi:predicted deacetylase